MDLLIFAFVIEKELRRTLKRGTILIRREDRIKLIQLLSAWMYENNQFFLHFEKIPEILNIKEYFDLKLQIDIDHYLHDFLTCSFLSKDPDGNYRFSHKSFVDFFVAKKLVEETIQDNQNNWSKYTLSREITRFIGEIVSKDIETINKICEWAFEGESHLRYNASTTITCMDSNMVVSYVKKRKDEPK